MTTYFFFFFFFFGDFFSASFFSSSKMSSLDDSIGTSSSASPSPSSSCCVLIPVSENLMKWHPQSLLQHFRKIWRTIVTLQVWMCQHFNSEDHHILYCKSLIISIVFILQFYISYIYLGIPEFKLSYMFTSVLFDIITITKIQNQNATGFANNCENKSLTNKK